VWKKDFTKQLELPGDIWNTRFFKNCIKPIAETISVKDSLESVWSADIITTF